MSVEPDKPCHICGGTIWWYVSNLWGSRIRLCDTCHPEPGIDRPELKIIGGTGHRYGYYRTAKGRAEKKAQLEVKQ